MHIYKKIWRKVVDKNIPVRCLLEITHKCNLECIHCYVVRNRKKELTTRQFFNILEQIKDLDTLHLIISGGEPLVREDFFEIAEYAKRNNFALRIFTNATLINSKIAEGIKKLKPLGVEVSLYGLEKTHDEITQVKGSFKRAINGIKLLSKREVNVLVKCTILRQNIYEIWELRKYVERDLKVRMRSIGGSLTLSPCDDGNLKPLNYLPTEEQLKWYIEKKKGFLKRETKKKKPSFKTPDRNSNLCGAGITFMNITPYGEVNPCVQIRTKNKITKNRTIRDIWENGREFKLLRNTKVKDLKECINCEYEKYCFRCPGIAYLLTGSFTKPYPEACRQARIRKQVYLSR